MKRFGIFAVGVSALLGSTAIATDAQSYYGATEDGLLAFGQAVAVDGGEVFVGEPGKLMGPGTVYVYQSNGGDWQQVAALTSSEGEVGDGFGQIIAVSDGRMLIAGNSGVFAFENSGGQWVEVGKLAPSMVADSDQFGSAIALDGDHALVSAPAANSVTGRVHAFQWQNGAWVETSTFVGTGMVAQSAFGAALGLSGNVALVGAPRQNENVGVVQVFEFDGSAWSQVDEVSIQSTVGTDLFGSTIEFNGETALIGAPFYAGGIGAVFPLTMEDGAWAVGDRLLPFDGPARGSFGTMIGLADGEVWVGSSGFRGAGGNPYIGRLSDDGAGWDGVGRIDTPEEMVGGGFGRALDAQTTTAVVGASGTGFGSGSAVVYERRGGDWEVATVIESQPEGFESITGDEITCQNGTAGDWGCSDVDMVSFLSVSDMGGERGVRVNDVWGWTDSDTGKEYALVGMTNQAVFVDISDNSNPVYLGRLPMTEGANGSSWRDVKVYENHAYVVSDGAGQHGMQIFDLTRLRDVSGEPQTFEADGVYDRIASAHNIVINQETGFGYAVGASSGGETCGGGLHMIDLRDPKNPTFAGCFSDPQTGRASTGYSHDAMCINYRGPDEDYQGREICFGANETALSIADVTDKDAPVAISRASYPNVAYSHQGWITEDHRYFYLDDELDELNGGVAKTRTLIWDVTDLDDPQLVKEHLGVESSSDHNLYIRGNFMYQSNYVSGLRILDISDPENPVEVGHFDTVPYGDNSAGFNGSWSNYPFFQSETIIVTSGREGLFLLKKRGPIS